MNYTVTKTQLITMVWDYKIFLLVWLNDTEYFLLPIDNRKFLHKVQAIESSEILVNIVDDVLILGYKN